MEEHQEATPNFEKLQTNSPIKDTAEADLAGNLPTLDEDTYRSLAEDDYRSMYGERYDDCSFRALYDLHESSCSKRKEIMRATLGQVRHFLEQEHLQAQTYLTDESAIRIVSKGEVIDKLASFLEQNPDFVALEDETLKGFGVTSLESSHFWEKVWRSSTGFVPCFPQGESQELGDSTLFLLDFGAQAKPDAVENIEQQLEQIINRAGLGYQVGVDLSLAGRGVVMLCCKPCELRLFCSLPELQSMSVFRDKIVIA